MSQLSDGDAVKNMVDAGMNAIKSAVVDEGVKVLKRSDEAKRYVKTGLDLAKALDSLASMGEEDSAETKCLFQCPVNARGVEGKRDGCSRELMADCLCFFKKSIVGKTVCKL